MARPKIFRKKLNQDSLQGVEQDLEKIQERAYFIWEGKGRPENSALEDWIEAERQGGR